MSLRPEIHGFDFGRFKGLFGGGDEAVVGAIETEFARIVERSPREYDESYRLTFREALRRAIHDGIPFPDLEDEGPPHVRLAVLLARHDQELHDTGSSTWKVPAFVDFWVDHREALDPRGRSLFGCFLKGRPLFGKRIRSGWS